jgi:L-ribulokinase
VPVTEFIVAGGLLKNAFLMQTYSDILRMPISIIASDQGPALGSAIHAAVAAGAYADITAASQAMGKVDRAVYTPDAERADAYDALFAEYSTLYDYFGRGGNDVMHRLKAIRRAVLGETDAPQTAQDAAAAVDAGTSASAADAFDAEASALDENSGVNA